MSTSQAGLLQWEKVEVWNKESEVQKCRELVENNVDVVEMIHCQAEKPKGIKLHVTHCDCPTWTRLTPVSDCSPRHQQP